MKNGNLINRSSVRFYINNILYVVKMSVISLNASMRSNLLSLQQVQRLQDKTQLRLSTGLEVNSAIDNPSAYYTASALNNRAEDLGALLDSMTQGIQTIKAANEALETGTLLLQQLKAVANQALTMQVKNGNGGSSGGASGPTQIKSTAAFVAEGYTAITSSMTNDEIQALIVDGAKLVLDADVTLSKSLNINADNVIIEGNGHKMSFSSTTANANMINISKSNAKINNIELDYANTAGGSAVVIDGAAAGADISVIKINAAGTRVYGIRALNKASVTLDNTSGISVSGTGSQKLVNGNAELFDGKSNTQAIVDEMGANGIAASAATQFYVGDKTGDFGQGNWYLPSIGELMQVYGYDADAMTSGTGTSGATGVNKAIINTALGKLGGDAAVLTNGYCWSSSEFSTSGAWLQTLNNGGVYLGSKAVSNGYVRPVLALENGFNPLTISAAEAPKIGDIMYDDKTWGSADDYGSRGSRTAVGVITDVSADGSLKILALKDLTFSSTSSANNFNPDNPYGGSSKTAIWSTSYTNISGINDYSSAQLLNAMKSAGTVTVTQTETPLIPLNPEGGSLSADYSKQYNGILEQYDNLIRDAGYKGINLLLEQGLKLNFNEERSSGLDVKGADASAQGLGLSNVSWAAQSDIEKSVKDLEGAIGKIRAYSAEFGNYYSIVTSREDFTENLINVLVEGADKLTQADMNSESAIMLALQTRQQLAINSLSLAGGAAQSILKLF